MPPDLFDKHGGFRKLHSFTLATIIQLETLRFCRRFLTFDHRDAPAKFYDPKGRQYDQMTQAARSGRQNIIEGSERSATSKDTEMKTLCAQPMQKRKSAKGPFWGCTTYPDCRGTRPI